MSGLLKQIGAPQVSKEKLPVVSTSNNNTSNHIWIGLDCVLIHAISD